jgi:hypothetical protein
VALGVAEVDLERDLEARLLLDLATSVSSAASIPS